MCYKNVHYTHGKKQTLLPCLHLQFSWLIGNLKIWFRLFFNSLCIIQFVHFPPVYKSFYFFSGPRLREEEHGPVSRQALQPGVQTTRSSSRSLRRSSSRSNRELRTRCTQPQRRQTSIGGSRRRGGSASEGSSM